MKDLSLTITIPKKLLKHLGYEKTPSKREMRKVIKNSLVIVGGLRDNTWKLV